VDAEVVEELRSQCHDIHSADHLAGNQTAQYVSLRLTVPERHSERNAGKRTAETIVQGFEVQKFNRFRSGVGGG
ncbi:MAG TPA: hypothetical protein VLM90_14575, partial [Candidatus Deferrimicrobium sp.]|nr:hypothetical protein [Candidatus Deferrimicrobium sp.]